MAEHTDPDISRGLPASSARRQFRIYNHDSLFDEYSYGGATYTILRGSSQVDEYTLGLSWTWNPLIRWQFNYVHVEGNEIQTGDSNNSAGKDRVDDDDLVGLRMFFKF